MRIRETRSVGGGMGGGRVEDRISIVKQDASVPITATVVSDTEPVHDWQEVGTPTGDPHTVPASLLTAPAVDPTVNEGTAPPAVAQAAQEANK